MTKEKNWLEKQIVRTFDVLSFLQDTSALMFKDLLLLNGIEGTVQSDSRTRENSVRAYDKFKC